MKKTIYMLICCGLFITFMGNTFSKTKIDSKQLITKLEGYWLNEEFMSAIKKTKSYMEAIIVFNKGKKDINAQDFGYTGMAFYKNENKKMECNIFNPFDGFNGEIELNLRLSNPFEITLKNNFGPIYKCIFALDSFQDPSKITWENNGKKVKFVKIKGNEKDYVNKITLVGKYKDNSGKVYVFKDNKTAEWPNKTFKYNLGLDAIWASDDFIYLVDDKNNSVGIIYCYEWKSNKLYIYNGLSDQDGYSRKDLCVVLQKSE